MAQLVFTNIADIDKTILETLDIDSFIAVCKTNKYALKVCDDKRLWLEKFNKANIDMDPTFNPKTFNDWVNYYNHRDYVRWMNLERRPMDWQGAFKKLDEAIDFRNDIRIINETDNDLDYRHIFINIFDPNQYQYVYEAIEDINDDLDFDDVYHLYNQFRFKYRTNEYWLFFNVDVMEFDEYPDDIEDPDTDPLDNPDQNRISLTEKEFKLVLTLMIYGNNYTDIYDHNTRSFIATNLIYGGEGELKRQGMLEVLKYLHKNDLLKL